MNTLARSAHQLIHLYKYSDKSPRLNRWLGKRDSRMYCMPIMMMLSFPAKDSGKTFTIIRAQLNAFLSFLPVASLGGGLPPSLCSLLPSVSLAFAFCVCCFFPFLLHLSLHVSILV